MEPVESLTLNRWLQAVLSSECAALGPYSDCRDCLDCVVSKLLFRRKFWIYWLHIAAALVMYRMFAR